MSSNRVYGPVESPEKDNLHAPDLCQYIHEVVDVVQLYHRIVSMLLSTDIEGSAYDEVSPLLAGNGERCI